MRIRKKIPKIYTLSSPITGEVRYIGKTHFSLRERLSKHIVSNENKKRAKWIRFLKSQGMKPVIELIEIVDNENWILAEKFWIEQFRQWGFELLNIQKGGKGGILSPQCKEAHKEMLQTEIAKLRAKNIHKFSVEKSSKKVLQFDKQGNFLQEHASASEAARKIKGCLSHITECCNEKPKRLSHKGFRWKYKVEDIV